MQPRDIAVFAANETITREPEIEKSWNVPLSNVNAVLQLVDPKSRVLCLNDETYQQYKRKIRSALYFYLPNDSSERTDRLVFKYRNGGVVATYSPKWSKPGERWPVKHQLDKSMLLSDGDLGRILENGCDVDAALVKVKQELSYSSNRGRCFKVGLHRMVPFLPHDPTSHGDVFVHVEFEAVRDWTPELLMSAPFFERLNPVLVELMCKKRDTAHEFANGRTTITFKSAMDLRHHVVTAIESLQPIILGAGSSASPPEARHWP